MLVTYVNRVSKYCGMLWRWRKRCYCEMWYIACIVCLFCECGGKATPAIYWINNSVAVDVVVMKYKNKHMGYYCTSFKHSWLIVFFFSFRHKYDIKDYFTCYILTVLWLGRRWGGEEGMSMRWGNGGVVEWQVGASTFCIFCQLFSSNKSKAVGLLVQGLIYILADPSL